MSTYLAKKSEVERSWYVMLRASPSAELQYRRQCSSEASTSPPSHPT